MTPQELLRRLDIERADFFGYSMGAGIALEIAIRRPELVRRLAVASLAYDKEGFHAAIVENIESTDAEDLAGSIFQEVTPRWRPTLITGRR
jgi:pimeloyl-ACP methyl ester carboxylesterase